METGFNQSNFASVHRLAQRGKRIESSASGDGNYKHILHAQENSWRRHELSFISLASENLAAASSPVGRHHRHVVV
jgi:hypothetical protein